MINEKKLKGKKLSRIKHKDDLRMTVVNDKFYKIETDNSKGLCDNGACGNKYTQFTKLVLHRYYQIMKINIKLCDECAKVYKSIVS